jgi:hypothetical protein
LPGMRTISSATKICLIQMAVADIGLGLSMTLRFSMNFLLGSHSSRALCMLLTSILTACGGAAQSSILLFAANTCWTIRNMAHKTTTTRKRNLVVIISIIWIVWIALFGTPILFPSAKVDPGCHITNGYYSLVVLRIFNMLFYLHVAALVLTQALSLYWLMRHRIWIHENAITSQFTRRWLAQKRNVTITIVLLLSAYIISVAPVQIAITIFSFCPNHCGYRGSFVIPFATLAPLKSFVTVFIYLLRIKEFRNVFVGMFGCRNVNKVQPIVIIQLCSTQVNNQY